ncbi:MAG: hypothetical protein EOM15_04660 [Spirochaetia bacterium]|nr:hypothetical protein [Spirochaetia bacterium]
MMQFEDILQKTQKNLDKDQLEAVYADTNCVVSAGAGSGKTTVLSYRFLRLVLQRKAKVDEILTLTFTRKAAAEMHQRIHQHLLLCKDDPEIAKQLATFSEAPISTLDSFCTTIVRGDSVAFGIAQDFVIDDEQNNKNARKVAKELIDCWPQSKGARIVSELYAPDVLLDEVLLPLANKHYFLPKMVEKGLADTIFEAVRAEYESSLDQFLTLLNRYTAFTDSTKTVQGYRDDALVLQNKIQSCASEGELKELLCSKLGHRRAPGKGKSDDFQYLKESLPEFRLVRKKLCIALSILTGREQLDAVIDFCTDFVDAYHKEKRTSGILTFSDVSSLAVEMLIKNKPLRAYYKNKYRYIMIDEFQDNNEQQKALLYLLAEQPGQEGEGVPSASCLQRDKLFFVGDEKQSIYRFRGSDVSVFKQLSTELTSVGGAAYELSTNYRSEPALIQWFNSIFPSIMAHDNESYEADFKELSFRNPSEGIHSSCTLLIKEYEPEKSETEEEEAKDSDAEAYAVASMLRKMLDSDEYLIPCAQGMRRPEPNDMALLLRSTSNQLSFEKAFRRMDIPYTVQAARSLMLEAVANDFYAMLQLAIYPDDKLAYATTLRSPFCNLSDHAIAVAVNEPIFDPGLELSESDRNRFFCCKAFYDRLLWVIANQGLSDVANALWYESGYYLSLTAKAESQVYLEHFTFFHRLAQMQEEQGKSISQFLDYLRDNLVQNEKIDELNVIKESEQGVQIMSIHKSKGLEFPIVVLANTGSKAKNRSKVYSDYGPCALPFALKIPYFVSETKQEYAQHAGQLFEEGLDQALDRAELKRLLYVALTRAETHLVISGVFGRQNRDTGEDAQASTHLKMLCDSLGLAIDQIDEREDDFLRIRKIQSIAETLFYTGSRTKEELFRKHLAHARLWYDRSSAPYSVQKIRYATTALVHPGQLGVSILLPSLPTDAILSAYAEEQVTGFGTFVHRLCEQYLRNTSLEDIRDLLPSELSKVLNASELSTIIKDAQLLCENLVRSSWYAEEIAPYLCETEVGFFQAWEHEGRRIVVEGSIDLLVHTPQGLLVVDFKTDRYYSAEAHRQQVETYMEAVRRIYGQPVRGCVLYLRNLDAMVSWEKDNDKNTV